MPIYRVATPDGKVMRIEGPEGASNEQIEQVAKEYYSAASQVSTAGTEPEGPGIGDRLMGIAETVPALATGMTTGAAGFVGGAAKGIAESLLDGTFGTQDAANLVAQKATQGAESLTYMPRSQTGQEIVQAIGETAAAVGVPAAGLPAEMAALSSGARAAAPAVRAAAEPIVTAGGRAAEIAAQPAMQAVEAVKNLPGKTAEALGMKAPADIQQQMTGMGAADVPIARQRAEKAANLPVPVELTLGAETRSAPQLAFEKEAMKGEAGGDLRRRAEENNLQILQNFETLVDDVGAEAPDLAATGNKVVNALSAGYKEAKNKTRVAYRNAFESQGAQEVVDPTKIVKIGEGPMELEDSLISYINKNASGLSDSGVPNAARRAAINLGIAEVGPGGQLVPKIGRRIDASGNLATEPATVAKLERLRSEINDATGYEPVDIRQATIMKKLIDATVGDAGGPEFQAARKLRMDQARKYENRAIVARLITNRKGMDDPQVAVDQVFQKSVLNGSPEELTFLKRVLKTSGEDGQQAWKELQAATMRHIRDEATKGMGMDSADNPIVSPAKLHQTVSTLDKNGRLDIMLGKKNAEIVRDLNDVARYVSTVPPGTLVNTSGTAGVLLAAMAEAGATGALTGLPVPMVSVLKALGRTIQDKKMKIKINAALNKKPKEDEL